MGGIREKLRQGVAQRKRQLALHPTLTMTDLYNVLSLGGTGGAPVSCLGEPPMPQQQAPLTPKQRAIHEQGLVTVLRQLHDELDAAVAEAYGWGEASQPLSRALSTSGELSGVPSRSGSFGKLRSTVPAAEILDRLVALNAERAAEEARGLVRYLRPEYQAPQAATVAGAAPSAPGLPETHQPDLALPSDGAKSEDEAVLWPKDLAAQIALVRDTITRVGWQPADGVKALAKHFTGVRVPTIQRNVDALVALGQV